MKIMVEMYLLLFCCFSVVEVVYSDEIIHSGVKVYDECEFLEPDEKEACLERHAQSLSKLPWWAWLILAIILFIILLVVIRMLYVNITEGDKIEERRRERKRKRENTKIMQGCGWTKRKESDGNQVYRSTREQTPKQRTTKCTHLLPNGCTHEVPYSQNGGVLRDDEMPYKGSILPPYIPAPGMVNGGPPQGYVISEQEQQYPQMQKYMFRPQEEHIEMYDLNHHSHHQHEQELQCQHGHQLYPDQHIHNQQIIQGPTNDSPHSHHHHHNTGASEYEAVRVVYGHPADSVGRQQSPAEVIYGHPADIAAHQRIEEEENKQKSMYGHPADSSQNGEEANYAQFRKKERTSVYV